MVVHTFNEGEEITPTKTRQHVLTPKDGKPLAIAIVWERWEERNSGTLLSFAMVTVSPNKLIATITDRMPAIINEHDWAKWLGEEPATTEELKALLMPYDRDLEMRPQEKTAKTRVKPRKPDTEPKLL